MADGINISIDFDKKALGKWEKQAKALGKPVVFKKALALAINRALSASRTQAKREIAQRFVVKQKDVADNIKERRASTSHMGAELLFVGPNIPALKFKIKPADPQPAHRPVINIQYKKDGGGPVPGRFVAAMKSGHVGVFVRDKDKFMRNNPKRQAISRIMGPSAAWMVGGDEASEVIQDRASEVLAQRIDHEMRRLLFK